MKKKSTAYRIVQVVFLALMIMLLSVTVWAQETTLTTTIPSSHTLHMEVTGNGTIKVDGVAYTKTASLQVQRQHRPEISILAADGKIKTVLWDGDDVTAAFQSGKWTTPEIVDNVELTIIFEKLSDTPQTGDNTHPELWIGLLIFSTLGLMVCLPKRKKISA